MLVEEIVVKEISIIIVNTHLDVNELYHNPETIRSIQSIISYIMEELNQTRKYYESALII